MLAKLYGHRGARGERPENTIEGFLYAKSLGVAGIETDIAVTADFVPVLHHDPKLVDGRLIRHVGFADLPASVPSLARALHAVPEIDWLLEIKTYPDNPEASHPPALMAARTLATLEGMVHERIHILAFDWAVLRAVAVQAPAIRRVCLTAPEMADARDLWWGPEFGGLTIPQAVAATQAFGWAGLQAAMSEAEIVSARALGLKVFAWTVDNLADFRRLAPLADGIITDHPARFLATGNNFVL